MNGAILKRTVESLFSVVPERSNSEEMVFLCPMPECGDQSGNRSVNLKSGQTGCWRCNVGGDFVKWANRAGYGVTDMGSTLATAEDLALALDIDPVRMYVPTASDLRMPYGFTRCEDEPDSVYSELIERMAIRKNLDWEDLLRAGAGYTREGQWEPFTLFPVEERGKVVYFQGRTYVDVPGRKTKLFPSRKEAPLGARYWVYGIDELEACTEDTVVVVMESILNVLSMRRHFEEEGVTGFTPVCVFKHSVGKEQLFKLLKCPRAKEICLMFDLDASAWSWKVARKANDLVKVTVAEMAQDDDASAKLDPNDDARGAMAAILARTKFDHSRSIEIAADNVYKRRFDLKEFDFAK